MAKIEFSNLQYESIVSRASDSLSDMYVLGFSRRGVYVKYFHIPLALAEAVEYRDALNAHAKFGEGWHLLKYGRPRTVIVEKKEG